MSAGSGKELWSSRTGFLLASIGGAVGLGNVWRFPFIAGENGGGAFVLLYVACIAFLGIPIVLAELIMGRRGKGSAVGTMAALTESEGAVSAWRIIGWLSVLVPMLGLTYYSVVAGWSLDYLVAAATGVFSGYDAAASAGHFNEVVGSAPRVLIAHAVFIATTVFIVSRGIRHGIERAAKWMTLSLFSILILLVVYAMVAADFAAGLKFLFTPDFSKLSLSTVVVALGQAFFSLAVAVGMLITFGAYVPKTISLARSAIIIAIVDTSIAILAGLVIFPLVFEHGLSPSGGPGLIFVTLPIAFGNMPGGIIVGSLFFLLIAFAALTTGLGMLEPAISYLEERSRLSRRWLALLAGLAAWLVGLGPALSFNLLSDVRPLAWLAPLADKSIFDAIDYFVANVMLPLNGLLIALFAGWCLKSSTVLDETGWTDGVLYQSWRFLMRFVAPIVIGVILVNSLI